MNRRTLLKRIAVLVIASILSLAGVLGIAARPTRAAGFTNQFFAPYVDMSLFPTPSLTQITQNTGLKFYTLAFITSANTSSCLAAWGGSVPLSQVSTFLPNLQSDIQFVRSQGGDVTVSFGGEGGTELADSCTSVSALQAQYQSIITQYHLTHIDFDIEGADVANQSSIDLRNKAIAALQQANPGLFVSYTLPVLPSGLVDTGVSILRNAIQNGVNIGIVNIMAMDYGSAFPLDMGQNAINAGNALFSQLQTLFPSKSAGQIQAMEGITLLIGINDDSAEITTEQNARQVLAYAQQNRLGELSMWSEGRDKPCATPSSTISPTCSGINQQPEDFTNIFDAFNGVTSPPPPPTPTATTTATATPSPTMTPAPTGTPTVPAWDPNFHPYQVGNEVSFQGHIYQCIQAHTSQPDWSPPVVPALWQLIS